MLRAAKSISALLLAAGTAYASPWWATFDGSLGTYPEDQGWLHYATDPPAQRWLQDGSLFIDSRAAWGISDIYSQYHPREMTLAPGEKVVAHWTVKVDEEIPAYAEDLSLGVSSDVDSDNHHWGVSFQLATDGVHSGFEPGNWAPFEAGVFHDFCFESWDFRTYTLSIDGVPALAGNFFYAYGPGGGIGWGDNTTASSLSEWKLVECGILAAPEPGAALCVLFGMCFFGQRGIRRACGKDLQHKGTRHENIANHGGAGD
jgi:hypothetical protein